MFEEIRSTVRRVINRMFAKNTIEKKLDIEIAMSETDLQAINEWLRIYQDRADWLSDTVMSMNLGASISAEIARLVTLELKTEIIGNDYLQTCYEPVIKKIRRYCELACAGGGLVFKPYVSGDKIIVDAIQADRFYPTSYNSNGDVTGAVFVKTKTIGKDMFVRFEEQKHEGSTLVIKNTAYKYKNYSDNSSVDLTGGKKIELTEVPEWADIEPETTIENIEKALFSYFKVPAARNEDTESPIGASVFAKAINKIKIADEQWSRIWWEFEGTELAVHASNESFERDDDGNFIMPEGKERLYRAFDYNSVDNKAIETFSPTIRDTNLFNGLNNALKRIEFDSALAYGTLSDPQNVDKTAEEIRMSKQRSYQMVSDVQGALQEALEGLIYDISVLAQLYELAPSGDYEASFDWDDSVISDKDEKLKDMREDVAAELLRPEIYVSAKYGVSEDEALKMMPKQIVPNKTAFDPYTE